MFVSLYCFICFLHIRWHKFILLFLFRIWGNLAWIRRSHAPVLRMRHLSIRILAESPRGSFRTGKSGLENIVVKITHYEKFICKCHVPCGTGSVQVPADRRGSCLLKLQHHLVPQLTGPGRFPMQLLTRQGSASCIRVDGFPAQIAGSVYLSECGTNPSY